MIAFASKSHCFCCVVVSSVLFIVVILFSSWRLVTHFTLGRNSQHQGNMNFRIANELRKTNNVGIIEMAEPIFTPSVPKASQSGKWGPISALVPVLDNDSAQ